MENRLPFLSSSTTAYQSPEKTTCEDGPGLYGTVCFHPFTKSRNNMPGAKNWRSNPIQKAITNGASGAYGFYNSLNTDGPVGLQERRADVAFCRKRSTTYWRITQKLTEAYCPGGRTEPDLFPRKLRHADLRLRGFPPIDLQ